MGQIQYPTTIQNIYAEIKGKGLPSTPDLHNHLIQWLIILSSDIPLKGDLQSDSRFPSLCKWNFESLRKSDVKSISYCFKLAALERPRIGGKEVKKQVNNVLKQVVKLDKVLIFTHSLLIHVGGSTMSKNRWQ